MFDQFDASILNELQRNASLSNVDLADRIGLSESACLRRVKNLESKGVITHYAAHLDEKQVGLPGTVFVRVSLVSQREEQLLTFEEAVSHVPEVMECYLMSGDVDYIVRVVVRDAPDYERIHHTLTNLPGVDRVHSSFALRTILRRTRLPI
ncbi:MAG: Lrp/AsnC family transcriptional regulator [Kordiimonadaceae bacterium]|nr:Lrp/AsnC family transcriptional regulator [Kordiimonadaceae bacterium]MBO6570027.1 Lrp/AsnC family transcriptional regulator [Kordiimonadaceae bacterium]MBO6965876.1 Lrp/AsnC family transcriptional regulator [Kordiimonadaceae bacterium]